MSLTGHCAHQRPLGACAWIGNDKRSMVQPSTTCLRAKLTALSRSTKHVLNFAGGITTVMEGVAGIARSHQRGRSTGPCGFYPDTRRDYLQEICKNVWAFWPFRSLSHF